MPFQKALGQEGLPPLLPAPALQEAADASSGQTQHILSGMPQQQHDRAAQPQTPAVSVVPLSTEHGRQTGSAACGTVSPGNGGAQSRPAAVGRQPAAKTGEQQHRNREAPAGAEPPVSCAVELVPGHAAPAPQKEASQPVRVQADIVDLVSSSSDDSRSNMPAAQQAPQGDVQSARREGVLAATTPVCVHKRFHAAHEHRSIAINMCPGSKLHDS